MPHDALIGHTGFVGSNLLAQRPFTATFNSATIDSIDGRAFEEVVCAGVSAVKWWANQNPDEDRARIESLMRHLEHIRADRFTLISTIDVYDPPLAVTEDDEPQAQHPYGANRIMLERFVAECFPLHQIIRLPALFGSGLKKNAIYDLMHNNRIELINPAAAFQWYPLDRLGQDLQTARTQPVTHLNLATEPLTMEAIRTRCFPTLQLSIQASPPAHYDMHSLHAEALGGSGAYLMDRTAVLNAIAHFVATNTPP
ncbi:hypothetical protein [Lichenicoccus sp.]|uniref:hypothetical protein n=1 Tax=Lichenicoccus sp. TaxID=2781899 RepID=UPI003D110B23